MEDKKEVLRIDENGFRVEPVLVVIGSDEPIPSDCIETPCPEGFYKPKWNGTEWVEGLTQTEIDAIKNITTQPTKEEILSEELANIKIDNMKKDVMMTNLLKVVADLRVEVMNLKGGNV